MTMLYVITRFITAPGAYLRCFWEHLTCRLFSIPIENADYFSMDELCGHIEHEFPTSRVKAWFITRGPGYMNFVTGLFMVLGGVPGLFTLGVRPSESIVGFIIYIILTYLGLSLLCNSCASVEDALYLWEKVCGSGRKNIVFSVIFFIPVTASLIGAYLEKYVVSFLLWAAFLAYLIVGA